MHGAPRECALRLLFAGQHSLADGFGLPVKDDGLIALRKSSTRKRRSAPLRNRCAPAAHRIFFRFTISHSAVCHLHAYAGTGSIASRRRTTSRHRPSRAAGPIRAAATVPNSASGAGTGPNTAEPSQLPASPGLPTQWQRFRISNRSDRPERDCGHRRWRRQRRRPGPDGRRTARRVRPARRRRHRNRPRRDLAAGDDRGNLRSTHAADRRAAGNLHGRQHRLPPGRPHGVRRPHVLRRPPPDRHDPQRRAAHAAAAGRRLPVPRPRAAAGRRRAAARPIAVRRPGRHWSPPAASKSPATPSRRRRSRSKTSSSRSSIRSPACRRIDPSPASRSSTHQQLVESQNNFLYVGGVPVFTGRRSPPTSRSRATTSTTCASATIRSSASRRWSSSTRSSSSASSGRRASKWDLDLDYLSERGFGFGTGVEYDRDTFFALAGPTKRPRSTPGSSTTTATTTSASAAATSCPKKTFRGRAFWNHRQHLVGGLLDDWTVQGEVGWLSDRTFLEQYYEDEWDNNKDQLTGVRLKRTFDNQSLSLEANGRLNDFFTQTQWLPRLDHYWLGQPLIDDQLTWFEHSSAAYANIGIATHADESARCVSKLDAAAVGSRQRRQSDHRQGRAARHAAGDRLADRLRAVQGRAVRAGRARPLGRGHQRRRHPAGLRPNRRAGQHSVLGGRPDDPRPAVQPQRPRAQGGVRRRSFVRRRQPQTSTEFPLYDELDDDSIEEFRRRLFFSPFGGELLPDYLHVRPPSFIDPKFDPRFYALRSGLQDWVTSPSTEIADDLAAVRMGMRHRLQTKRGALGEERIVDWLTFDTNATWFPDADRDNFGARRRPARLRLPLAPRRPVLDPLRRLRRHVRRRPRTASIGVLLNRPASGNAYLGFRTMGGVFEANVVIGHGQLPHEPEVDRLGQRVDRLRRHRQHRPVVRLHPHRRIADRHGRAATTTSRRTTSASASWSSRGSCRSSA